MDVQDVIVVGGGLSGLSAAYELHKKYGGKLKITVLEARDEVGGRLKNETLPAASGEDRWDVGGQWVCSTQLRVMELLKEMNMEVFKQYAIGTNVMMYKHPEDVRKYEGLIPSVGVLNLLNYALIETMIYNMTSKVSTSSAFHCNQVLKWDSKTLQNFLDENNYFGGGMNGLLSCMTRVVFGCEPSQISLFFFLYVCSSANGVKKLLETTEGSAQEFRVKETAADLPRRLRDAIGRENVHCTSPVYSIDQATNAGEAIVRTNSGEEWRAKYVVVAAPPQMVNKIAFSPPLPNDKQQLNKRMLMGHLIKFIVTYQRAFWKNSNYSGESTVVVDNFSTETLCCTFDATTHQGNPALVGFIGGEHATYWSEKSMKEREIAVVARLVSLFGDEANTELIHYRDLDWSKEEYVGGCPVAVAQPGTLVYFHSALRRPFMRTHFAGTETANEWTGYMEGAVEAGQRAAGEVESRMESKIAAEPTPSYLNQVHEDTELFETVSTKQRFWRFVVGSTALAAVTYVTFRELEKRDLFTTIDFSQCRVGGLLAKIPLFKSK